MIIANRGAEGRKVAEILKKEGHKVVAIYNLFHEGKLEEIREKQLSMRGLFNIVASSVEVQVAKEALNIWVMTSAIT